MKITGGCHCGKITYEAVINLENVVVCHCTDCQRLSGSAFRTVAM
ncbi:MAG: GFA family protein, partial [Pseudomonadota bacterium]